FNLIAFQSTIDPLPHLALIAGDVGSLDPNTGRARNIADPVLVRVHRRDLLGDVFEDVSNPTAGQLRSAMRMIQREGRGVLVYIRPEGVGEDLRARLQQIRRSSDAADVNAPDLTRRNSIAGRAMPIEGREIGIGGQILRDLGLSRLRV